MDSTAQLQRTAARSVTAGSNSKFTNDSLPTPSPTSSRLVSHTPHIDADARLIHHGKREGRVTAFGRRDGHTRFGGRPRTGHQAIGQFMHAGKTHVVLDARDLLGKRRCAGTFQCPVRYSLGSPVLAFSFGPPTIPAAPPAAPGPQCKSRCVLSKLFKILYEAIYLYSNTVAPPLLTPAA